MPSHALSQDSTVLSACSLPFETTAPGSPHMPLVIFSPSPLMTDFPPTEPFSSSRLSCNPYSPSSLSRGNTFKGLQSPSMRTAYRFISRVLAPFLSLQTCTSHCLLDDSPPVSLKGTSNTKYLKSSFSPAFVTYVRKPKTRSHQDTPSSTPTFTHL